LGQQRLADSWDLDLPIAFELVRGRLNRVAGTAASEEAVDSVAVLVQLVTCTNTCMDTFV
jgi:hypothetical protein